MERLGIGVVEPVVRRGDGVDRRGEQRVRRGIVDALAVDEATAAVDERRAVLVPSHHRHRGISPSPQWLVTTSIARVVERAAQCAGRVRAAADCRAQRPSAAAERRRTCRHGAQGATGPREGLSPPEVAVRTVWPCASFPPDERGPQARERRSRCRPFLRPPFPCRAIRASSSCASRRARCKRRCGATTRASSSAPRNVSSPGSTASRAGRSSCATSRSSPATAGAPKTRAVPPTHPPTTSCASPA